MIQKYKFRSAIALAIQTIFTATFVGLLFTTKDPMLQNYIIIFGFGVVACLYLWSVLPAWVDRGLDHPTSPDDELLLFALKDFQIKPTQENAKNLGLYVKKLIVKLNKVN